MTEPGFIWDPDNTVDQKHGYYMFIGSIVFFKLLNILVTNLGKPKIVKVDEGKWNNLLISWIHGLISGTWDLLCLCLYPELLFDLFHHINYFTYLMIAFSTGYFVYDFSDLLIRKQLIAHWEVIVHHIAVTCMFWYNFHCRMCIGFNVVALMAEINSFFLHSRKLLHMLHYEYDNKLYRKVCIVNLVTFAICRGTSLFIITYNMFTDYHRVPAFYFGCLIPSIFCMNGINIVLFWRLFKNDILRPAKKQKQNLSNGTVHVNGNNNQSNHIKSN